MDYTNIYINGYASEVGKCGVAGGYRERPVLKEAMSEITAAYIIESKIVSCSTGVTSLVPRL